MSQILIAISNVLHVLATIVFIGHYLLLSLLYLPALSKIEKGGTALGEISRHSRSWLYASLIIFALTGIYLTLVDPNYMGIGNFSSRWAILMLVKHILIFAMVVMGFWFNSIMRVGSIMRSNPDSVQAITNFRRYVNAMSICGVIVLLLTVFAQVA